MYKFEFNSVDLEVLVNGQDTVMYVCMYVCKIYVTSVKNVIITKSSIYNTNLNQPRQISFVTS